MNAKPCQWKLSGNIPHQPSCDNLYSFGCFPCCFSSIFCILKPLLAAKLFNNPGAGLSKICFFIICYYPTFFNDLFIAFIICRIGDILFLNSSINAYHHSTIFIFGRIINPYAFLQNQLYTCFSNPLAKSNQFGRYTWNVWLKILLPTEVLIVKVLGPLLYQVFSTLITDMF